MTTNLEYTPKLDAKLNQNEISTILFDGAYGHDQQIPFGKFFDKLFDGTRERLHAGKFTEKDTKAFKALFEKAAEQANANPDSMYKALNDRATQLNAELERLHANAGVEVIVHPNKGKGTGIYKDVTYELRAVEWHPTTKQEETIGFVKWADPKIANQPIEEKTTS